MFSSHFVSVKKLLSKILLPWVLIKINNYPWKIRQNDFVVI